MTKSLASAQAQRTDSAAVTSSAWEEDEAQAEEFKPLTREEAREWRTRQPGCSVWRVVGWQVALTVLVAVLGGVFTQRLVVATSVVYGGLCAVLPTALMAYGITSSALAKALAKVFPGVVKVSLAGVLFWEGIKVLLALIMLWSAPHLVPGLSWLALVAGLVVALKAYWLEWWMHSRRAA